MPPPVDLTPNLDRAAGQIREQQFRLVGTTQHDGRDAPHEAMKISDGSWPVFIEDVQERCLKRIYARARFIEYLSPQRQTQAILDVVGDRREQQPLAHVFGNFKESALLGIKTEAEKVLMLAALNLVECIAETAPQKTN